MEPKVPQFGWHRKCCQIILSMKNAMFIGFIYSLFLFLLGNEIKTIQMFLATG